MFQWCGVQALSDGHDTTLAFENISVMILPVIKNALL